MYGSISNSRDLARETILRFFQDFCKANSEMVGSFKSAIVGVFTTQKSIPTQMLQKGEGALSPLESPLLGADLHTLDETLPPLLSSASTSHKLLSIQLPLLMMLFPQDVNRKRVDVGADGRVSRPPRQGSSSMLSGGSSETVPRALKPL